jgi:hypothetical protein
VSLRQIVQVEPQHRDILRRPAKSAFGGHQRINGFFVLFDHIFQGLAQ